MKTLHAIIPTTVYKYQDQYYSSRPQVFNELSKHFDLHLYVQIKQVSSIDTTVYNTFHSDLTCHHLFDTLSVAHVLKHIRRYRKRILALPASDLFLIFYPHRSISLILAWLLRTRKLVAWVKSDTTQVLLSWHMIFSSGLMKSLYRLCVNLPKAFVYQRFSNYVLHNALVFYTANTVFNRRNHRNQHELISCPIFNRDPEMIKTNLTNQIIFVGNEHPRKGLTTLLQAIADSHIENKITLNLIGIKELKDRANIKLGRNLSINYHGPIYERTAFYNLLAQSDILVMPSFAEKQGKVQLEAMSAGVVPICSDSGGTYQTINNYYNGLLFKPGDSQELANLIDLLYQNLDLYNQLKLNGLDYTATLSIEKQAEKMATITNNHFAFTR